MQEISEDGPLFMYEFIILADLAPFLALHNLLLLHELLKKVDLFEKLNIS